MSTPTTLPLTAWTHAGLSPIGLLVTSEALEDEHIVTGWRKGSVRCSSLTTRSETEQVDGLCSVSLLSLEMALRALRLLRSTPDRHGWLHPLLSLLTAEQIAEAIVATWTLEHDAHFVGLEGLLRVETDGRITTIGDLGGRAQYDLSVRETRYPKGEISPHTHIGTLSRRIGPYGDFQTMDILSGLSTEDVLLRVERYFGAIGYLFLDETGHVRPAREGPMPECIPPF